MINSEIKSQVTLREYFRARTFIVPYYQRGYVWGQRNGKTDSVSYLLNTLLTGFEAKTEVFLQGVTVYTGGTDSNGREEVTLIDGQQRTTFFYLLFNELLKFRK